MFLLTSSALVACSHSDVTGPSPNGSLCTSGTVQLAIAQAVRVDCSNGGTTVTLTGNGANYLIVPQFAISLVANSPISFQLTASSAAAGVSNAFRSPMPAITASTFGGAVSPSTGAAQRAFDAALRQAAASRIVTGQWRAQPGAAVRRADRALNAAIPAPGSTRTFRVLTNIAGTSFTSVTASLAFTGTNLLLYIDTSAPSGGFTPAQLQAFGVLFDQTLYPIDTAAFGQPTDVDANGRVIMLMTPAVNALTPTANCQTSGFVGGFFNELDLGGAATDTNSNHGEIFYSIVPDPSGSVSCAHSVSNVGLTVSATFLHELQHLISFSQHFVVHNGRQEYGWLDEGLSIVAEELGSVHYEQKCPGAACRTNPAQIFPDSSQGFIQSFLFDSYQYGLGPDTSSVTLHSDSEGGFSWRGGDWLLMRWLGDQMPAGFYKKLDQNTATGVANIESASGQTFPSLFANFGLALVTDSLPGLPRNTAPAANRFVSRNMRFLWGALFAADQGPQIPLAFPISIRTISTDSSSRSMVPGTNTYFRLNTPTGTATVTLRFAAPGGTSLSAGLNPQLAVFRLPPGQ